MEGLERVEELMAYNEWLNGRESTQELVDEYKETDEYKELVAYLDLTRRIYNN